MYDFHDDGPEDVNRIVLTLERHPQIGVCWIANYGGPHADIVRDLFGQTSLPTAFRGQSMLVPDHVRDAIAERNPNALVEILIRAKHTPIPTFEANP